MKTLEELKAENAQPETEVENVSATDFMEVEEEAVTDEVEPTEEVAEPKPEETKDSESEAWLTSEEESDHDSDVAKVRRKWKGRAKAAEEAAENKDKEIEELRAQLAQQQTAQPQSQPKVKAMPKLADFDYDEDAYTQAVIEWQDERMNDRLSQHTQKQVQSEQERIAETNRRQAVESHYQRAAEVSQKSGIDAATYQAADNAFRQTIEQVAPGQGDSITDGIIEALGEGSEKVLFHIGRNPSKQQKIRELSQNPYAMMVYLGNLKGELNAQRNKTSRAPKPTTKLKGDVAIDGSANALHKAYEKAKSVQEKIDIKFKAKAAGVDTKGW